MKKLFVLILAGLLLSAPAVAYADHGEREGGCGKHCAFKKGGYGHEGEEYQCPVTDKFMKKAHFYLENEKELGLSEEQVQSIKDLKMGMKKSYIQQMANHEIFMLDVMNALSKPEVDLTGVNAMVDQKAPEMAAFMKETVANYAKLKGVLTKEQAAKAKALMSEKKDGS